MKSENTIKWNVGIVGRTLIEFQIKKFQCFSFRFYLWLCRYSKESIVFSLVHLALGILLHCYSICLVLYTNPCSNNPHTEWRESYTPHLVVWMPSSEAIAVRRRVNEIICIIICETTLDTKLMHVCVLIVYGTMKIHDAMRYAVHLLKFHWSFSTLIQ